MVLCWFVISCILHNKTKIVWQMLHFNIFCISFKLMNCQKNLTSCIDIHTLFVYKLHCEQFKKMTAEYSLSQHLHCFYIFTFTLFL